MLELSAEMLSSGRGEQSMKIVRNFLQDTRGQDLIEYALMAGFVAVAAGAIMPTVTGSISTIFSKIGSVLASAAGG
jgi:pilus assembly protein Flp/PilA